MNQFAFLLEEGDSSEEGYQRAWFCLLAAPADHRKCPAPYLAQLTFNAINSLEMALHYKLGSVSMRIVLIKDFQFRR